LDGFRGISHFHCSGPYRHGEGWEQMRAAVGSPDGWRKGLVAFATTAS
jgi:hypothetical protein